MLFSYSPQRSDNTRLDYRFEISKKRILITYRTGSEITKKTEGVYDVRFHENSSKEYILNLDSERHDFSEWPFTPLIELKAVEGIHSIKLLKPYGPEEESNLAIRYPGWNKVDSDISETSVVLQTSLNDFQQLSLLWMDQLAEIKCQIHNLLCYLSEEYKRINLGTPPFPSPISIRALKTSILQNTILYIEAGTNFLSALAICINDQIGGSPKKIASLEQQNIDLLTEANRKYCTLEDKMTLSIECLNRLMDGRVKIDKGRSNWNKFKDLKRRRDSITHVKLPSNSGYSAPTLDNMVASVQITDADVSSSLELICWFNTLLNDIAKHVGHKSFPSLRTFNDYIVGRSVGMAFSIAGLPSSKIIQNYNVEIF